MKCYFVSDLHGAMSRFESLFYEIEKEPPDALLIGGDIFPGSIYKDFSGIKIPDFINGFLRVEFLKLKEKLGPNYPKVFIILGNDDGRNKEATLVDAGIGDVWFYCHMRSIDFNGYNICGYSYIPPSPFLLKDWEKYDVSRYVDPGCISPAEGNLTVPVPEYDLNYGTISEDLERLTEGKDLSKTIFMFHSPPYKTALDRAALDEKLIDYVPVDVHIGSIAIRRLIEKRNPFLTLHGHVHESSSITGKWRDRLGDTEMFSAAYDGKELSLIKFDTENLELAVRLLI